MAQANEPSDKNRDIERQLRSLNRRVERLEYTQVSPQEFSGAFDRVYDEIDALEDTLNGRCDRIENEIRELKETTAELNRKFDIVMQYITGQGGS